MKIFKVKNYFKGDMTIWIVFFLLCMISILEVYSSSSNLGYRSGNYTNAVIGHTFYLLLGVVLMVITLHIPCRYFKVFTKTLVLLSFISLIMVYSFGVVANDAARWLSVGGIHFQPSELAKGSMVLFAAHVLSDHQNANGTDPRSLKQIAIAGLPIIGLILIENFSTAFLLAVVLYLMFFVARIPGKVLLGIVGIVVLVALLAFALVFMIGDTTAVSEETKAHEVTEVVDVQKKPKRGGLLHRADLWKKRIETFLDDEKVPAKEYDLDKNKQVGNANIAIAKSNIIGLGPGNSEQRDHLPLAFSDFIYAIIIEEMGILGAFVIVSLYCVLLFRTGQIARRCKNTFPAYLAMGLALLIVTQAFFNMLVAVGLAPVTGQPLPLISKGGTSSIFNCIYIGVILSVSRTAQRVDREEEDVENEMAESLAEVG